MSRILESNKGGGKGCGKILALDFGERRIGVAVSDESQALAFPLCVIDATNIKGAILKIKEICQRKNIKTIVLGLPLTLKGEKGPAALKAERFAQNLKRILNLPVVFEDERLTSKEAEKLLKQRNKKVKGEVDIISAVLILEQYLKRNSG